VAKDGKQYSLIQITKRSRNSFGFTVETLEVIGSSIHIIAHPVTFLIQAFHKLESPPVAGLFFSKLDNHPLCLLVYVVHHVDLASLLLVVILVNTNHVSLDESSRPAASQLPKGA
jgi:uncharacterized integral membrane protein